MRFFGIIFAVENSGSGRFLSWEPLMPAGPAQQDDENKVGCASVTKSPVACRLANLACSASVHGVPAPPLPKFDFLRSRLCQRGWLNKTMKIPRPHRSPKPVRSLAPGFSREMKRCPLTQMRSEF